MKRSTILSLCAILPLCACAATPERAPAAKPAAPGKRLTLEDLYHPDQKVDFSGRPPTNLRWIDAGRYLQSRRNPDTRETEWVLVEADTGAMQPFLDTSKAKKAIAAIPGVDEGRVARLLSPDAERLSPARDALLVTIARDLWVVRFDSETALRITSTPEVDEEEAAFSPDGKRVAFVADNDLFVGDAVAGGATRLTNDGSENVLNGKLDWIYQEEIYGRGTFRSFWWSPDSRNIAFLRLDQTGVPLYTLVDDTRHDFKVETSPYPRPGETNPSVRLRIAGASSGEVRDVDLTAYAQFEPLVVDVSWSPDNRLVYQVQDREQVWLELRLCAADASGDTLLVRETTPAWVERTDSPTWLADGTFLWFSERSGWKHLYRYRGATCLGPVTQGEWEVRDLHGVDEARSLVYFSGTERSHIGSDVYLIGLDGRGLRRLSQRAGTHSVKFNPTFTRFLDTWSDIHTPPQVRLHRASDGFEVRTIDANDVPAVREYARSVPELLQVKTRDGFVMEAMLIKPLDFDPAKKYPAMMFVYSGPHAQTVRNSWGGTGGMFQQMLAQQGFVVWSCDNRSASGKGAVSTWACYQRMGESELADIEDSIDWLVGQGFVDPARVGITGWSYGGFMTAYALTHSKKFALGVAGGSVTDWRSYDSIYTERYMRTPANNKDGYERTSVVKAAGNLTGHLVLVHGAMDDNVHPANTTQLAYALQKAGKPFELMLYGRQRHGVVDPQQALHWRTLMRASMQRLRH